MEIQLTEGVFWDTEAQQQSDEAIKWMQENVLSKLAKGKDWGGKYIQPFYDKIGRPMEWVMGFDTFIVRVINVYQNNSTWALKSINIQVKEG